MKITHPFAREARATASLSLSHQNREIEENTMRQWALLLAPPLLISSMWVAFRGFHAVLGPKVGYFTAFVCYWLVWCLAFPLWILRGNGLARLFRRTAHPLGKPAWIGLLLLLFPPVGAAVTIFARRLCLATPLVLLSSAALAIVNAIAEEVLWRGIYPRFFPHQLVRGYLYPAVGFALWHLVPQSIHPSRMRGGTKSFLAGAFVIGLGHGWVAWRTGSIRWTLLIHILTDFLGLGGLVYFGPGSTITRHTRKSRADTKS
jgi:membrane protease YdiL (CAAX protease family)